MLEFGPARESVLPGKHELYVSKGDSFCENGAGMLSLNALHDTAIAGVVTFQQLFCLLAELLQRRARGQR